MSKDKIKTYILEIILLLILFLALFVSNIFDRKLLAFVLVISILIIKIIFNKKRVITEYKKQMDLFMLGFALLYLCVFYIMGFFTGFYIAPVKFTQFGIVNFLLPTTIIIITSEMIRSLFINDKDKISNILIFISMVLIDLIIYTAVYNLNNLEDLLAAIGFIFFASIANNLLYTYVAKKNGVKGIIYYRLITCLYVYIIPIIPNVFIFFRTFLRMLYPLIIYMVLESVFERKSKSTEIVNRKKNMVISCLIITFTTVLVMLISCQFSYGVYAIGSNSMKGTIDKGDVILFKKYNNEPLSKNKIVVFERNGQIIIHRIVDIKNVNGSYMYFTKGDANQNQDTGYITKADIVGLYEFKVSNIGYPTIWINEIFGKG